MWHGSLKVYISPVVVAVICLAAALVPCSGQQCASSLKHDADVVSLLQVSTVVHKGTLKKSKASAYIETEAHADVDLEKSFMLAVSEEASVLSGATEAKAGQNFILAVSEEASVLSERTDAGLGAVLPGIVGILLLCCCGIIGMCLIYGAAELRLDPHGKSAYASFIRGPPKQQATDHQHTPMHSLPPGLLQHAPPMPPAETVPHHQVPAQAHHQQMPEGGFTASGPAGAAAAVAPVSTPPLPPPMTAPPVAADAEELGNSNLLGDLMRETSPSPREAPIELCEGMNFVVPDGETRQIKVPALPVRPDPLFDFDVSSMNEKLFIGQYVASHNDPFSAAKRGALYDEHISMSTPDGRELATLVVGTPPGKINVEAHIKYGAGFGGDNANTGFGFVRKNPADPKHPYEVIGRSPLSISTNEADNTNRTLRIFDLSSGDFKECATATCYITGQGKAWYEVTVGERADMLYVSMVIMGVDRVSYKELNEMKSLRMWK